MVGYKEEFTVLFEAACVFERLFLAFCFQLACSFNARFNIIIDLSTGNTNNTLEGTGPSTEIMTEIVTEIINSTTPVTSSLATLNVTPTTVGRCKC